MSLMPVPIIGVSSLSKQDRALGKQGESVAVQYLTRQGFAIRFRNYHTRYGEIDIVAERDGIIHCIEVKTRQTQSFGPAVESITATKQQHLWNTFNAFIEREQITDPCQCDLLTLELINGEWQLDWHENILDEDLDD